MRMLHASHDALPQLPQTSQRNRFLAGALVLVSNYKKARSITPKTGRNLILPLNLQISLEEESQSTLAKDNCWADIRVRLVRQIVQKDAFLTGIDSGWIRMQRREPGQILWADYTDLEAKRALEAVEVLKDTIAKMDEEERSVLNKEPASVGG